MSKSKMPRSDLMRLPGYLKKLEENDKRANEILGVPLPTRRFIACVTRVAEGNGLIVNSVLEHFREVVPSNTDWLLFFDYWGDEGYVLVTFRTTAKGIPQIDFNTRYIINKCDVPKGLVHDLSS